MAHIDDPAPDDPAFDDPAPDDPASEPQLVRIGAEEWREFRDVRLASLRDAPDAFGSRHADWVDADEDRWRGRLRDVPLTVVARWQGAAVGVVCGAPATDGVELISMWVAPAHRGTGLAQRLVDEVVSWADARGQATFLTVRDDNTVAIRAYRRAGFIDQGVRADGPEDGPPERRMFRPCSDGTTPGRPGGTGRTVAG